MSATIRQRLQTSANSPLYTAQLSALPASLVGKTGTVGTLSIAPIKALGMVTLSEAAITWHGLSTANGKFHDRGAMVLLNETGNVDGKGYQHVRLSQREIPALALISVTYDNKNTITYEAKGNGMQPLRVTPEDLAPRAGVAETVRMFPRGNELCAVMPLERHHVTNWLRRFLEGKTDLDPAYVSLGVRPEGLTREVPANHRFGHRAYTVYSDGDQILVANPQTLAVINGHLRAEHDIGFREIVMTAFRPEVLLDGLPAAAEDVIETITIDDGLGGISILLTCHCVRCPVTQVDARSGTRPDKEPLKYLARNRPHRDDAPTGATFGWNALFLEKSWGKLLRTGMTFKVETERP